MAFRRGGGKPPKWSISFSVRLREGEYKKGPSIGLWPADAGPMARGTTKGEYAEQLAAFFDRYAGKESGISVSLFENDGKSFGKKKRRDDDDEEERSSRRRRSRDEDDDEDSDSEDEDSDEATDEDSDDEDEERPAKKKSVKKAAGKKPAKKKRKFG